MSESPAPALVEVVPAPQTQPPATATAPAAPAAPPAGAVPGVPLAVAVANALGGLGAGALSLGGPATLAVAGTAAGVVAVGGLARRVRTARQRTPNAAVRRAVTAQRAGAGGVFTPAAGRRTTPQAGGSTSGSAQGRYGAAGARGGGTLHRSASVPAQSAAPRKGPSSMGRPATTPSPTTHRSAAGASGGTSAPGTPNSRPGNAGRSGNGLRHRVASGAAHTLAKAAGAHRSGAAGAAADPVGAGRAARRDERLAKVAERTARRVAKGQAKAERAAGIDPATGAGAVSKSPAAASLGRGGVSPVQAKALRRSAMRHRARMAGAVAATGLVGLASAAVGNWRHKGKVAGHMRRTWTRMAARARAVRAARDAAIRGTTTPATTAPTAGQAGGPLPAVPVPAQSVNVPGRPSPTPAAVGGVGAWTVDTASLFARIGTAPGRTRTADPITLGKPTVKEPTTVTDLDGTAATFSLSSAADVLLQAATTFDPENMIEFQALADDLPVAFATIQDVLRVLAEKGAEQLPLDPVVPEEIAEGYRAMGKVVQALEEVGATFRKAHAEDLERHENPRNGLEAERKWNV
ncbi:hypothetical protein [Streptomyces sp. CB01881]|uniref:hypothetical protein n=1 Tax=Streptomyces sp. CB01881 TaxID=2078691 RepID=UPI000CDC71D2|nr:hypothetical protein [Streptomyces sp. CB01881]AUY50980.1 hypothetical protein C2142_20835 [Streptomyces sp. CB01881]TYC74365.1 hypothetical protein EH183_20800 [Streptomyces sp. CB01881]